MLTMPALAGRLDDDGDGKRAHGVWSYLPATAPVIEPVGPHTFMKISDTGDWSGTISGYAADFGEVVVHESGPWYYFGTVPLESATVNGRTGMLLITVFGSRPDVITDWEGTWEIVSGTGELADLQGHGTWEGAGWQGDPEVPGEVTYEGRIKFK